MNEEKSSDTSRDRQRPRRKAPRPRRYADDPLQALTALDPKGSPPEIPLEKLDPDALRVVHRLRAHGHQAYLVGGCVRDLLLGDTPKDFDVATSAHPPEIRAIFRNCRLIGRRFRLAHIYFANGKVIETATFRANPHSQGPNGEVPAGDLLITHDNVFGTAEQDALRRDFTVNGLFYDVILGRVIDYVGGREDLEKRQLRTIGDPFVRMQEDPVRILRAVRFAAKSKLTIEPRTWEAMGRHKEDLARCAPPRILEEIFRLLRTGRSERSIELLHELGALRVLLPPLAAFLEQAGPERAQALFESLRLMDEVVRRGPLPDDSVLLSLLLVHHSQHELIKGAEAFQAEAEEEGDEDEVEEIEEAEESEVEASEEDADAEEEEAPQVPWSISASAANVDELLGELVRSARLPKRIAERARQILHAQRILSGARRRRVSPQRFVRQRHFADALLIYELYVRSTGHGADSLERWKERYEQLVGPLPDRFGTRDEGEAPAEGAEATEARAEEPEEQEPQPAGSKRRRRRRRGKGRGAEASGEAGEDAAPDQQVEEANASDSEESLPPLAERLPPPGPADLLPF